MKRQANGRASNGKKASKMQKNETVIIDIDQGNENVLNHSKTKTNLNKNKKRIPTSFSSSSSSSTSSNPSASKSKSKSTLKSKPNSSIYIEDSDSDNEVMFVEAPDKNKQNNNWDAANDSDDEIQVVGQRGKNPMVDFPHARHQCLVNR